MSIGMISLGFRSVGAVLLGYAVLVLGAFIFQDALFGHRHSILSLEAA